MLGLGFSPGSAALMASAARLGFLATLPGVVASYDPSDLSTLFQDAAGTIPAGVGDPVRLMLDKSGLGRNMRAPSDAARPILRSSGGLFWLEADGVDDRMIADDGIVFSQTVYTALAYRLLSFSTQYPAIMSHAAPNPNIDPATRQPLIFHDSANPTKLYTTYGTRPLVVDIGTSVVGVDLAVDSYFTTSASYKNVNGITVTAAGATLTNTAPEALRIFGDTKSNARFYGAIRTHTIPTAAQQSQIRQWLAAKSGGTA